MQLRSSILVLSVALALGAIGCKPSPKRNATSQNAQPQDAGSPQAVENSDGSKAGTTSAPEETKTEVKTPTVARYTISAAQSHVTVRVFVGGLFAAFGHDHTISIRDVAGDVQLTPDTIEPASLRMTIKASSAAETGKEFNEKDRQEIDKSVGEEALETAKYPEIVFKSTKISVNKIGEGRYQAKIGGDLTLHGVTRPIVIPSQVTLNGDTLRAHGEFPVRHGDFNMKRLSAGAGTVKAKDEMKLSFDIVAHKY